MKTCKVQFETRFTHILNFHQSYKVFLNPFLAHEGFTFTIENVQTLNESIRFQYESSYHIDCRMDRIIFLYEGDPDLLNSSNGPIKLFFNIVEAYKKNELFGHFKLNIILGTSVEVIEQKRKELSSNFKKKYFTNLINEILKEPVDIGIIIEDGDEDYYTKVEFGLFQPSDFQKYQISPFNSDYNSKLKDANGLMSIIQINEKSRECNFEKFKSLFKEQQRLLKILIK